MLTEEEMYITFKNEVEGSGQISQEQMKQELRTNSVLHPALKRDCFNSPMFMFSLTLYCIVILDFEYTLDGLWFKPVNSYMFAAKGILISA